jgi:microcystin-dependent protein
MAENTTPRLGLPYPSGTGKVGLGSKDIQELAEKLDALLLKPGILQWTARPAVEEGWLACEGQAVSRATFKALFEAIGTAYGPGDGSTTFNLPDYRERAPVGAGAAGRGLASAARGATGGEATHKLTEGEIPAHAHGVNDPSHVHGFGAFISAVKLLFNGGAGLVPEGSQGGAFTQTASATTGITIQNAGGSGAHNNLQPYQVANVWIKT